ncbi:MAG: hypothetical protein V1884_02500 [Candidatus Omnitrophota bacterium]
MTLKKDSKGVALIFTLGLMGLIVVIIATLLMHLKAQVSRQQLWMDRVKAHYLCQTGLSVAMLDLAAGKVPSLPSGQSYTRTFTFTMGARAYDVTYKITNDKGSRIFYATVPSPQGLNYTYYLKASGQRAFPAFIRGKP